MIVPSGDDILNEGDIVYIPVRKEEIFETAQNLGVPVSPVKKNYDSWRR